MQGVATGGVAVAAMAEEEEGTGVSMLTLALATPTKMELVTLQLPMKLLKVVQQQLQQETGQATEVVAEEEDEVREASAATVGLVEEAIARQPLLQRQLAMSLLLRKALHLCRQMMAVAGISFPFLHPA